MKTLLSEKTASRKSQKKPEKIFTVNDRGMRVTSEINSKFESALVQEHLKKSFIRQEDIRTVEFNQVKAT